MVDRQVPFLELGSKHKDELFQSYKGVRNSKTTSFNNKVSPSSHLQEYCV